MIARLRRRHWSGPRIADELKMPVSTVTVELRRLGLNRLSKLAPPVPVVRYERAGPESWCTWTSWTSGGDTLICTSGQGGAGDGETLFDIWLLPFSPAGPPVPWLRTAAQESHPVVSPDGRWIAYASDASGRPEVYVRRFPGPGGEVQVSTAGGWEPVWSPEGERIYYRDTSGDSLWVVPFRTERNSSDGPPAPRLGRAELLLTGRFLGASSFAGRNYDLAPDGRRFLMILEAEDDEAAWMERTRIDVIVNWLPEMRRRTR